MEKGEEQKDIGHYGKWRKEKSKKILGLRASGEKKRAKRYWVSGQAEYMATPIACWWAGAIIEVIRSFGQEQ